ncbi:YwqG family protein [Glycomyces halotolerans]
MTDTQELAALADQHLPPEIAERWKTLLRPAIQFGRAADNDLVAAQLGGEPELPPAEPWPEWERHGPLSFIGSFDCTRLSIDRFPLPADGTLLFFYFDGQVDDGAAVVGAFEPGTQAGARVLYVPAGTAVEPRTAPEPIKPYPLQQLRAEPIVTAPEPQSPRIQAVFGAERGPGHPVDEETFIDAVYEEVSVSICHQVGGHPLSIQGPVEYEAAEAAAEVPDADGDPAYADPDRWLLLAQIDTDDGSAMTWGDAGMLYWLIQAPDLAAQRFDRTVCTMQCA